MNTLDAGPNVEDLLVSYRVGKEKHLNEGAYGPYYAKLLTNWIGEGLGGFYTQRNADNYAWFTLAQYVTSQIGFYPTSPSPGMKKPTSVPLDPDGDHYPVTSADSVLDPGTSTTIGANPDDDLLGTEDLDPAPQAAPSFSIPGCPYNYPSAAAAVTSPAPTAAALYCTNPSLEDGDGICTCSKGTVTTKITPVGGPGNACPTAI